MEKIGGHTNHCSCFRKKNKDELVRKAIREKAEADRREGVGTKWEMETLYLSKRMSCIKGGGNVNFDMRSNIVGIRANHWDSRGEKKGTPTAKEEFDAKEGKWKERRRAQKLKRQGVRLPRQQQEYSFW